MQYSRMREYSDLGGGLGAILSKMVSEVLFEEMVLERRTERSESESCTDLGKGISR